MDRPTENSQNNSHSDLAGLHIGDYRLLRRLGSGGMADVYLAVQESLKRQVALKVLKRHLADNESYVDRFKREAQAAAGLVHANIVQIFEVGQASGYHFIAQEYVRGRNLKQYLSRYGAAPPDMALSVLRQSAMALQKGAEHDVVHRDIKPENILLTANGEIKIADFGLARVGNQTDTLTQVGITVGTPLYMSPEQIEGKNVDIRSDIYSLGVTLYHMLVGQPPFDGDSPLAIALKHKSEVPESIREHRDDLPSEFEGIVDQMLSKTKEGRPQSPVQLLKMLQPIKVETTNGFDWQLFEAQPQRSEVASDFDDVSPTISLLKPKAAKWKIPAWWIVGPAAALLALAAWWGGAQVANRYSGLKNLRVGDASQQIEREIPKEESVEKQYLAAYWNSQDLPSESYDQRELLWKAVETHFPIDAATDLNTTELYHLRAKCRLGEIYLESGDLGKAEAVYEVLAEQDEMSLEFRTTGLAGKAITYYRHPVESFLEGGALEQQSEIRLCLDDEVGGVRENFDLLNAFLKEKVAILLEEFKSYGGNFKYSPPPPPAGFAARKKDRWSSWKAKKS